ncbi:MAG: amino acid permease, partial [Verrucomicrobia bacterium]|nr:amino acid permease [Verrucomicrobiota bacterium]
MHKQGAILLVAGTCIGSGMIALPMVLAKLGLLPSVLLMLSIWFIMYYTSLVNVELNLQAGRGLSLGALGRLFSGKVAEALGTVSLKLLSYSLLAVFIYGGSSIVQQLLSTMQCDYSFTQIASCYTLATVLILLLPIKFIDYFNRMLFIGLVAVVLLLVVGLTLSIEWSNLPLVSRQYTDLASWAAVVPVVFTSFGFQVIFHTLTNYCGKDPKVLKSAFFWGSLIPAVVYILWTCSTLSAVHHDSPAFYSQMIEGKAEVGELIQVLSGITQWESLQVLVWAISLLAIATSVLGVGAGLCESLRVMLPKSISGQNARSLLAALITVLPAYAVVMCVPNAFIAVLGFAGMILAVIAVLLPVYLLSKLKTDGRYYQELRKKGLIVLSTVAALAVIICEI